MQPVIIAFLLGSILLSACAQVLLKLGAPQVMAHGDLIAIAGALATSWQIIGGLACYGFSVLLWIKVLSKLDLSLAYPFVSLGFLLTTVLGATVLGESVSGIRAFGTILVVAGCYCVARSA